MAEKPILFNTEMVRAILDGRKTQTRRLVKDIPLYEPYFTVDEGIAFACDEDGEWHPAEAFSRIQPGDVLWVRETWCKWWLPHGEWTYRYKATSPNGNMAPTGPDPEDEWLVMPWKPSIHMPRDAARLFLRVTGVRIQRLQEITSGEAVAEGIKSNLRNPSEAADALIAFEELWNSTVKPADQPQYGWNANPWVWVIVFERVDRGDVIG